MRRKVGRRMSMRGIAPVPRDYIIKLIEKVDYMNYGYQIGGGKYTPEEQRMRNKALISLLYLSARRISEIVGRTTVTKDGKFLEWSGVRVRDFSKRKYKDRDGNIYDALVMRCEILKKSRPYQAEVIMLMDDEPFISYILSWLEYVKKKWGMNAKLFDITPTRSLQILKALDPGINNHWFRHMRLSHLAEYLNPYQLTERIGHWESVAPAVAYVHGRVSEYLKAVEQARRV